MPCNLVDMIRLHYFQISQMLIWVLTPSNLVTNSQDLIHVQQSTKIIQNSMWHSEYQNTVCLVIQYTLHLLNLVKNELKMWNIVHIKLENTVWSMTLQTYKYTLGLTFQQFLFLQFAPSFLFAVHKISTIHLKLVMSWWSVLMHLQFICTIAVTNLNCIILNNRTNELIERIQKQMWPNLAFAWRDRVKTRKQKNRQISQALDWNYNWYFPDTKQGFHLLDCNIWLTVATQYYKSMTMYLITSANC
jgi:hypothetical protein